MPRTALPKAVTDATTGAQLARALNVDPKSFRRWLRRTDVHLAKGATLTPEVKAAAVARYANKGAKGKATS